MLVPALSKQSCGTHTGAQESLETISIYFLFLGENIFILVFIYLSMGEAEQLSMCLLIVCMFYFMIYISSPSENMLEYSSHFLVFFF